MIPSGIANPAGSGGSTGNTGNSNSNSNSAATRRGNRRLTRNESRYHSGEYFFFNIFFPHCNCLLFLSLAQFFAPDTHLLHFFGIMNG